MIVFQNTEYEEYMALSLEELLEMAKESPPSTPGEKCKTCEGRELCFVLEATKSLLKGRD